MLRTLSATRKTRLPRPARFARLATRALVTFAALTTSITLAGCASPARNPVPEDKLGQVVMPGMPGVRFWGDEASQELTDGFLASINNERKILSAEGINTLGESHMLALSGGGADGAFGAGLLCGWTAAGNRPNFKIVTGISTGALIAPFAFLGAESDAFLSDVYTSVCTKDLIRERGLLGGLFSDAMADTDPMRELLAKYIDQAFLDRVAEQYAKGRLLIIATTQMDSQRPVVWSMGAIAASKHPKALELFREVMIASASIPAIFPPVMIDVEADGKMYEEMHADGGVTAQVFLYPAAFSFKSLADPAVVNRKRHLYIVRNSKIGPSYEAVPRKLLPIAGRATSTLIKTQGVGDLYRMYLGCQRDGLDFNLAVIPESFKATYNEPFDPIYMKALFKTGFDLAKDGYPWEKAPPGFAPPDIAP